MAEPNDIDSSGKNVSPAAAQTPDATASLPLVESPSISPAADQPAPVAAIADDPAPAATADAGATPVTETATPAVATLRKFSLSLRARRSSLRAATVALAAGFGAIIGALASQGLTTSAPKHDVASLEERQAMQNAITRLARDITALKASVETANKTANVQIGRIAERIDRFDRAADTTGSIGKMAAVPTVKETPLPPPRPQIVVGWSVRESRDGYILVEGRGEIYRVSPGVPLPGLGPVEAIRRDGGKWVVVTPKGIITSAPSVAVRTRYRYPSYHEPF